MQQAAEVDLDRLVDYKTEYCSVIKKHKITGDNLTGLCPFHDDRANSFSVDLKTGMWHCFAEDEGGNFVTFYAKLNGLDTKEAYKQILEKYGALNEPQEKPKEKKPGLDHYTVSQYSFEKRLPEDWLKEQCCLQTKKDRNGVQYLYIPYFDAEKNLALHRKRYGGKQFRWEYGKTDRLCMYGLWQIEAIRNIGYAALVEGESDSQSMWYMGISTLGIPGASMMRADWAPLLRIIKQRIFFVYNWGGSKGGKTAALKAALSVWGDPERLMVNFNATQVGLERTASFYCDLPLGIDERQLAGNNQNSLEKIVYMIASGTGKIRGAKSGGIQATQTWRTVALATGEEPLSTETSQTGVSTRVLEIYGGPFDDEREASVMHQQSGMNCGWAGPAYIGMLLHTDERSITEKYDEMMQYVYQISKGKSGSHIAGIAAVALADAIIDTWVFNNGEWLKRYENGEFDTESAKTNTENLQIDPESWERAKEMARNILQEQMNADTGDVNENATQYIVDWILSNKDSFGEKAFGTCLGMIQNKNAYIFPSMLTQALTKAGYSSRKTLKYLADKGLIGVSVLKDGSTKNSVTKWFNNRNCRFVEFHLGDLAEEKDPLLEEEEIAEQMKPQQMNLPGMGDGWQTIPDEEADKLPFN